jgi:ElaB/YqjD/DUF883 family membrane-anchored ribosome-binding protein
MSETTMTHSPDGTHLKESAVAVKDAVAGLAGEAGRYAKQRLGIAKESATSMLTTVKAKAEVANETVVGFIRRRPYTSLAIAAGIGLAVGILLRRRR